MSKTLNEMIARYHDMINTGCTDKMLEESGYECSHSKILKRMEYERQRNKGQELSEKEWREIFFFNCDEDEEVII